MSARSIVVHVERVVLDGLQLQAGGADALRGAIADAIVEALELAAIAPDLAVGGAVPSLRGAVDVRLPRRTLDRAGARVAGTAIGHSVGRGLTSTAEPRGAGASPRMAR